MAYLGAHQTPFSQPYVDTLNQSTRMIQGSGVPAGIAHQTAVGHMYRLLIGQSQILAYMDVFSLCALLSFCIAPLALLLYPVKPSAAAAGEGAH